MKKSLDEMYMDDLVDISKINNAKIQEKVFLVFTYKYSNLLFISEYMQVKVWTTPLTQLKGFSTLWLRVDHYIQVKEEGKEKDIILDHQDLKSQEVQTEKFHVG